jgi:hypothetical protein
MGPTAKKNANGDDVCYTLSIHGIERDHASAQVLRKYAEKHNLFFFGNCKQRKGMT